MSDASAHPVETLFATQRAMLESASRATREAVALRGRLGRAMLDSLEAQRSLTRRVLETSEAATDLRLTLWAQSMPAPGFTAFNEAMVDAMTEVVREQYAGAERTTDASWTAAEAWLRAAEELSESADESTLAMVDAAAESAIEQADAVGRATVRSVTEAEHRLGALRRSRR